MVINLMHKTESMETRMKALEVEMAALSRTQSKGATTKVIHLRLVFHRAICAIAIDNLTIGSNATAIRFFHELIVVQD